MRTIDCTFKKILMMSLTTLLILIFTLFAMPHEVTAADPPDVPDNTTLEALFTDSISFQCMTNMYSLYGNIHNKTCSLTDGTYTLDSVYVDPKDNITKVDVSIDGSLYIPFDHVLTGNTSQIVTLAYSDTFGWYREDARNVVFTMACSYYDPSWYMPMYPSYTSYTRETPEIAEPESVVYNGKEQFPELEITSGSHSLKEGRDYEIVDWYDNINAGTAEIEVEFIGDYSSFKNQTVEFTIEEAVLTARTIDTTYYLDEIGDPEIEVTGFVRGESEQTIKWYTAPENGEYVPERIGTFEVTPTGGEAENYRFKYVTGYVTVVEPLHKNCAFEKFTDLGSSYEKYHEAIDYIIDNGYFKGISEWEFDAAGLMKRSTLVTILARVSGMAESAETDCVFSDVDTTRLAYAVSAINWGHRNQIVMGMDEDTFGADYDVTIEQAVVFIYRYMKFTGANVALSGSYDISGYGISDYASEAMTWAFANNIIDVYELENAQSPMSRILLAQMLYSIDPSNK